MGNANYNAIHAGSRTHLSQCIIAMRFGLFLERVHYELNDILRSQIWKSGKLRI